MKKSDLDWLRVAIGLSKKCNPSPTAFCVGAVIVDKFGNEVSSAYSRETEETMHAEEIAIEKALVADADLKNATMYSSLEPCGERLSGKKTCVETIIASGIIRVVFAQYEPETFVKGEGEELLQKAGVETVFLETGERISIQ